MTAIEKKALRVHLVTRTTVPESTEGSAVLQNRLRATQQEVTMTYPVQPQG